MASYNVMIKIHVWVGLNEESEESFAAYFEINEEDKEAGVGASQFDKDLGTSWYDDDLIGSYYTDESEDLEQILDELPVLPDTLELINGACQQLKIEKANAIFYYEDAELEVKDTEKKYNGLTYIGVFDNS